MNMRILLLSSLLSIIGLTNSTAKVVKKSAIVNFAINIRNAINNTKDRIAIISAKNSMNKYRRGNY